MVPSILDLKEASVDPDQLASSDHNFFRCLLQRPAKQDLHCLQIGYIQV